MKVDCSSVRRDDSGARLFELIWPGTLRTLQLRDELIEKECDVLRKSYLACFLEDFLNCLKTFLSDRYFARYAGRFRVAALPNKWPLNRSAHENF